MRNPFKNRPQYKIVPITGYGGLQSTKCTKEFYTSSGRLSLGTIGMTQWRKLRLR